MPHIEGEEALKTIDQMFNEYHLEEYNAAWEAVKADFTRMGAELRAMKEGMKHGKDAA